MNKKNLRMEIPAYVYVALARRGMEKISLDQCFLPNCDNKDKNKLEALKMEEFDDEEKHTKIIDIKCHECGGIFKFKLETLKKVARKTKKKTEKEDIGAEEVLSMGLAYALDEDGKNLGHIGYF